MERNFDPFEALRALSLLVLVGFLLAWRVPRLRPWASRLGIALLAVYLLGGLLIFLAAYFR
jgi:hypothetical protein